MIMLTMILLIDKVADNFITKLNKFTWSLYEDRLISKSIQHQKPKHTRSFLKITKTLNQVICTLKTVG